MASRPTKKTRIMARRLLLAACAVLLVLLAVHAERRLADRAEAAADSSAPPAPVQSEALPEAPEAADYSRWALLGNSYIDGFAVFDVLPDADCFYRIGLTVRSVFDKPMLNREIPVIDELAGDKQYDKVFTIFGENELGWVYESAFYDDYCKVIDAVRERQPDAEIYALSILPVSKKVSEANIDQTNNDRIREYNELIAQMCADKGVTYLDVNAVMRDAEGNLPADAASDGIHPGIEYYRRWADFLVEQTAGSAASAS